MCAASPYCNGEGLRVLRKVKFCTMYATCGPGVPSGRAPASRLTRPAARGSPARRRWTLLFSSIVAPTDCRTGLTFGPTSLKWFTSYEWVWDVVAGGKGGSERAW